MYQIFHKAEANDLIYKNPVRFADKMRNLDPAAERECFTAEEVSLLMTQLPRDRIGASIRLMLGTGMRTQEILALEPRHIEEDGSVIHIRQAINMIGGMIVVVIVAFIADCVMAVICEHIPIGIEWTSIVLPLVLAWYIVTELGSILENAVKMGANVPQWLIHLLKIGLKAIDEAGEKLESETVDANKETDVET